MSEYLVIIIKINNNKNNRASATDRANSKVVF